jgi:hypothetical protein
MPRPNTLVYNDLTGDEIKHILQERFAALLNDVPYLQKHITIPRVKMILHVELQSWADQTQNESQFIQDTVEIRDETAILAKPPTSILVANDSVDASRKGDPPDKIREDHGLGIPTPKRGPVATEDTVEGRRVAMPDGATVDRTGKVKGHLPGTVVEQDFGPGRLGRNYQPFGNSTTRDGAPVERPVIREDDKE